MAGKLPIDRAREAQDAPKVYDEHRERFASHRAEVREADDPVSGARPDAGLDDPVGETSETSGTNEGARDAEAPPLGPETGLGPDEEAPVHEDPDGP